MAKKLSKLQMAQQKAEAAAKKTNQRINELGGHTSALYTSLTTIQSLFDRIRNVPEENMLKYEKLKAIRVNWKQQAEKIELEYQKAEVKAAGQGAAGVGAGVAVVALGPTAAMGIATTFGVASTGTAISALSGAAATNAGTGLVRWRCFGCWWRWNGRRKCILSSCGTGWLGDCRYFRYGKRFNVF